MNQLSHQYGTYERQKELLEMIKEVDKLFCENGIVYSLCGGTLLGAVRENGFIPWDDDIDIMVDRSNYNKLHSLFMQSYTSKYVLKQFLWIDRIQKIDDKREGLSAATIDVFVMDNCPNNQILQQSKVLLIKLLQGMMKKNLNYSDKSLPYKVCLLVTYGFGKPFSSKKKFEWYQAVAQMGNNRRTEFLACYTDLFKLLSKRYPKTLFDRIIPYDFEDTVLPITAEYDTYLKTQYGDYLTPTEEANRVPIHID